LRGQDSDVVALRQLLSQESIDHPATPPQRGILIIAEENAHPFLFKLIGRARAIFRLV
jgi:hypothetical protein